MKWPMSLPNNIEELVQTSLSEAYSSLKEAYLKLKGESSDRKRIIKELKQELNDYKLRYNHLIKHLNERDSI